MLNRIVLIGRLTRDPELRFTQSGKAVCQFTLAVDRAFTGADGNREADFINIVVWNKAGENCAQYLAKGRMTAVDGRLQIRSYEDKDGNRRYATEVIAENVRFLSPKSEGGDGERQGDEQAEPWTENQGSRQQSFNDTANDDYNMPMTSEDLPF